MKSIGTAFFALSALAAAFAAGPASAGPYDAQWIARCITDNKDEGQTQQVVAAYCTCMVSLMPESEERTVTQWEKTHKREENLCGARAGWRGR